MEYRYASRMDGLSGNAIRDIFKLLSNPNMISFAGGMPAGNTFPGADTARIAKDLLENDAARVLQYGETEGWAPLRESGRQWLRSLGINFEGRDDIIVSGGQQAIDLICKAFIDPGDTILVEAPTFLGALHTMRTYQANIVPVPLEDDGISLELLEENLKKYSPKLVYIIPTFQNPSGITLSLEKRRAIPGLAAKYGAVVIEDDPYRCLRYRGEDLPPVQSFDKWGSVVHAASFSKVISPGMRIGMAVGDPGLIRKMAIGKQAADVHSSLISQAIIDRYLREGLLDEHIKVCIEDYKIKKNAMQDAIAACFPKGVKVTDPDGGLFIWAELPGDVDTMALLPRAAESGVAYIPGANFYVDGTGKNTMRLNFSNATTEKIEKGVSLLGKLLSEL